MQLSAAGSSAASRGSTPRRATTPVDAGDTLDISNPDIPEDLRHFLKDISIPPKGEEEEQEDLSVAEAARYGAQQ